MTSDYLAPPAGRRRHALLLDTLVKLVADCGTAASAVSRPIAQAPPEEAAVEVDLGPYVRLRQTAHFALDLARQEDAARWPASPPPADRRTFGERCDAAEAESVLGLRDKESDTPLAAVARRVADDWLVDRATALALIAETVIGGELSGEEILSEAAVIAAVDGLRMLHRVPTADSKEADLALEAERCLRASRHFALAAVLASSDLD
ncbi:hypothetical protein ACFC34_38010 [Streptomyces sp. NPDC056053]|uniref:hypothetical protein n=1 Tax=Streptomyces sp. NPDC056053 TaxID=3345696 RepID=UPI0035D6447D